MKQQSSSKLSRYLENPSAVAIMARLNYRHTRWLLTEFPGHFVDRRDRARRKRQKKIAKQKKREAYERRHPRLAKLEDLFWIALTIVIMAGSIWFLYKLILYDQNRSRGSSGGKNDPAAIDFLFGWLPVAIGIGYLYLLSVFWLSPFRKSHGPIRHLVLSRHFHWFAVALVVGYSIPITWSAVSVGRWLLAMLVNVLMVGAVSLLFQQVGVWVIARRKNHLVQDEKRRIKRALINSGVTLGSLIAAFVLLSLLVNCAGLEVLPGFRFFQSIAAGEASWLWIAGWIVVSASVIGVVVPACLARKSFAFRKQLVRGMRFEGKVTLEELGKFVAIEDSDSPVEIKRAIAKDFAIHRSHLRSFFRRVISVSPILLVWFAFLVILQICLVQLLYMLGQCDSVVREASLGQVWVVFTLNFLAIWASVESSDWFRRYSRWIRPGEARLVSPWIYWSRTHLIGLAVYLQMLILSLPIMAAAFWNLGPGAIGDMGFGLLAVALLQILVSNVLASLAVLSQIRSVLPRWSLRQSFGQWLECLLTVLCTATVIGVTLSIQWFGVVPVLVVLLALSFVFFANSIGVRYAVTRPA